MSNSCGSPEEAGKQRGRDGRIRREDVDDSQPEGKRLKLGNEAGTGGKDREAAAEDAIMPGSGREEPVPEGGGEGKSVSEHLQWLRKGGRAGRLPLKLSVILKLQRAQGEHLDPQPAEALPLLVQFRPGTFPPHILAASLSQKYRGRVVGTMSGVEDGSV
uniref:Uncharacterized protein n=1 Tax=Geospiza parvula TaxID=87175 RepID=A0A8C3MZL6_GEOPR